MCEEIKWTIERKRITGCSPWAWRRASRSFQSQIWFYHEIVNGTECDKLILKYFVCCRQIFASSGIDSSSVGIDNEMAPAICLRFIVIVYFVDWGAAHISRWFDVPADVSSRKRTFSWNHQESISGVCIRDEPEDGRNWPAFDLKFRFWPWLSCSVSNRRSHATRHSSAMSTDLDGEAKQFRLQFTSCDQATSTS